MPSPPAPTTYTISRTVPTRGSTGGGCPVRFRPATTCSPHDLRFRLLTRWPRPLDSTPAAVSTQVIPSSQPPAPRMNPVLRSSMAIVRTLIAALPGIRRGEPCGAPEPSNIYVNWPRRNRRPGTGRIGVTVRHDFKTTPRLPFPGTPPVITLVLSIPVNAFAVWSIT